MFIKENVELHRTDLWQNLGIDKQTFRDYLKEKKEKMKKIHITERALNMIDMDINIHTDTNLSSVSVKLCRGVI